MLGSVKQVHLNNEDDQEGRLCANTYTTGLKQITQAVLQREEKQRHILPAVLLGGGGGYTEPRGCTLSLR